MDFSKMTDAQLLQYLSEYAPRLHGDMYDALEGRVPYYKYPNIMNSLAKGYDPALMEQYRNNLADRVYDYESKTIKPDYAAYIPNYATTASLTNDAYKVPGEYNRFAAPIVNTINQRNFQSMPQFPSDLGNYEMSNNDLMNSQTGEIVASPGYFSPNSDMQPAELSAAAMLANNRQIGDSDYAIDDLLKYMSNEELVAFLRNLTNKGYNI